MHKILPTNENGVLYKIEQNGKIIDNVSVLCVKPDNTIEAVSGVTVSNGNYIRLTTSIQAGRTLIVTYDLKTSAISQDTLLAIQQDIEILKRAVQERITAEELNLYIEKLKEFTV